MKLFHRNEDGQVIVLAALGLTVLALMAGLAIDVGYLRYEKQQMQKATDAGALAAATVLLNYGTNTTQAMLTDSATADVTANGFANATVTASSCSTASCGLFSGNSNYVQVQVQQSFPVFFMHLGGWSVVAVADTAIGSAVGNASGCGYALDTNQGDTGFSSGNLLNVTGCGIYVNSNATTSGAVNATEIGVVGTSSGAFTPTPINIPAFTDPLGNLPMPAVPPCTYPNTFQVNSSQTLNPAVYCGGININCGRCTVTFSPTDGSSTYTLEGGGLNVVTTNGIPTLNGNGVTFYNTYGNGRQYGGINLTGATGGVLRAPTTGPYAGILVLQDRSVTFSPSNGSSFDNSNGEAYIGALYFPTTSVTYTGNSATNFATLIVAWQVTISGTANFVNYANGSRGSPIHSAALVQ